MTKVSDRTFTILQLALMDETGDSFYRMRWPAAELAQQATGWRVINLDARSDNRYAWALEADLFIAYQSSDVDLLPVIRRRRELGKKTLVEYNDNFYAPPSASPVVREWSSPLLWQTYERFMELADGIIVTGPGLEKLFKARFGKKPIHVLENHFSRPPDPLSELERAKGNGRSFGWAGSLGHISDFLAVVPVLKEVLKEFPDSKLHVMGNETIPELLRIPADRLQFTKWGSIHQYYDFWRPVQVGIAPLLDTPYNECRSDVKAVEMGALAVAPILTEAIPYRDFCAKTGTPTYRKLSELKDLLRKHLGDPALSRAGAARCHEYVSLSRVGPRRRERLEVYSSYLPAEPRAFSGPQSIGYQEIQCASPSGLPSNLLLQEAQIFLKSGNSNEALAKLRQGITENPDAPDLVHALARVLLARKDAAAIEVLKKGAADFPRDLRFPLLLAAIGDSASRKKSWQGLIKAVRGLDERSKRFFRREVAENAAQFVKSDPAALEIGVAVAEIFPEALGLRFAVGERLEEAGRFTESAAHFEVLKQAAERKGLNEQFLAGMEEGYVQAWYEALKARG